MYICVYIYIYKIYISNKLKYNQLPCNTQGSNFWEKCKESGVSRVLVDFPVNQQLPLDRCALRGIYWLSDLYSDLYQNSIHFNMVARQESLFS